MIRSHRVKPLLTLCFLLSNNLFCATIIWDIGNVLLGPNKIGMVREMGMRNILGYIFLDRQNPKNIRQRLFEVLDYARKDEPRNSTVPDDEGNPLPNIFCDYQAGVKSSQEILQEIDTTITKLDEAGYFCSSREREMIAALTRTIFDPVVFGKYMKVIPQGLALLKECANKKDADGTPINKIFILSNWDKESPTHTPALKEVLTCVAPQNVFISGYFTSHQALKPNPALFSTIARIVNPRANPYSTYIPHGLMAPVVPQTTIQPDTLIKQFGSSQTSPEETVIFIDDMLCNIAAAEAVGIRGIHCTGNYKAIRKQLKAWGAL